MSDWAPWLVAGGSGTVLVTREIWAAIVSRRKNRTETDANVDLLNGLVSRVKMLEESHFKLSNQLNEEIRLRHAAEEVAHKLRLRVATLEAVMRSIGAVIPPEQD